MGSPDGDLVHSRNDRGPTWGTDPSSRIYPRIPNAIPCQCVNIESPHSGIPINPDIGGNIFTNDPNNIRFGLGKCVRGENKYKKNRKSFGNRS